MTVQAANGRARFCAWAVFVSMAGTTMSFQVYHSVELGHMPAPLAVLYGVVPLCISMLLIEVVSGWEGAPKWTPAAAYLIIGGAMFLSAAATGAVVLRAAPPHSSLLFGLLLDGAAILAARFLMTAAKRDVKAEAAALESAAQAERDARLDAEAERDAMRGERDTARRASADAADREATLAGEVERLKADAATPKPDRRKPDAAPPDTDGNTDDIDVQAEALAILAAEPDISGSELGRRLGFKPSYGRTLRRKLTVTAPGGGG
jgi:hypothetical protein